MALAAVLIWGMTFVSSKVLVGLLDPYWYIVLRFLLAWGCLFLLSPRPMALLPKKQEWDMVLCGLAGVTFYYLFQNVALIHSTASNTGVITASSPLFTALILWFFGRRVKLSPLFFLGFALCIGGVAAISFSGGGGELHLLGDAADHSPGAGDGRTGAPYGIHRGRTFLLGKPALRLPVFLGSVLPALGHGHRPDRLGGRQRVPVPDPRGVGDRLGPHPG